MTAAPRAGLAPRLLVPVLLAVLIAMGTQSAEACSVCLSATDETREAYYVSTVLMMSLPFVLFGSFLFWLRRAGGRRDEPREAPDWGIDRTPPAERGSESR